MTTDTAEIQRKSALLFPGGRAPESGSLPIELCFGIIGASFAEPMTQLGALPRVSPDEDVHVCIRGFGVAFEERILCFSGVRRERILYFRVGHKQYFF